MSSRATDRFCVWLMPAALLSTCLMIGACTNVRPTDVGSDGVPVYLDEISDEERQQARKALYKGLTEGLQSHHLGPGDELDFIFIGNPKPKSENYLIGVGDRLNVDFYYHPESSRTVVVRPDGKITLPPKGDIEAAGLTTNQFAEEVRSLYSDIFRNPVVTVSVEEFFSALNELSEALRSIQHGRSVQAKIPQDGNLYLPLLSPFKVSGQTVEYVHQQVNELYGEVLDNVTVSVNLKSIANSHIFVFGEVSKPGRLTLDQPQTALQAIASAGGHLPTADIQNVKAVYWTQDGEQRIRTINLGSVMMGENIEQDMILPRNTALYVPPSGITKVDRFVDQYIRQMLLYNGVGVNIIYDLNEE